jgi:hypothetical protein
MNGVVKDPPLVAVVVVYAERSQPDWLVAPASHSITAMVAEGVNPEPVTVMICPSSTLVEGWAWIVGVVVAPALLGDRPKSTAGQPKFPAMAHNAPRRRTIVTTPVD